MCRAFRDIFTPFVHARHVLRLNEYRPQDLQGKSLATSLIHTKALEVRVEEFRLSDFKYDVEMNGGYAAFVARMLKAMPNVRSFT